MLTTQGRAMNTEDWGESAVLIIGLFLLLLSPQHPFGARDNLIPNRVADRHWRKATTTRRTNQQINVGATTGI